MLDKEGLSVVLFSPLVQDDLVYFCDYFPNEFVIGRVTAKLFVANEKRFCQRVRAQFGQKNLVDVSCVRTQWIIRGASSAIKCVMEGIELIGFQSLEGVKQTRVWVGSFEVGDLGLLGAKIAVRGPGPISVRNEDWDCCQNEIARARERSLVDTGEPNEVLVNSVWRFDVVRVVEQVEICCHRFVDGDQAQTLQGRL